MISEEEVIILNAVKQGEDYLEKSRKGTYAIPGGAHVSTSAVESLIENGYIIEKDGCYFISGDIPLVTERTLKLLEELQREGRPAVESLTVTGISGFDLASTIRELQADNETFSNDKAMLEISNEKLQAENERLMKGLKRIEGQAVCSAIAKDEGELTTMLDNCLHMRRRL